MAHGKRPTSWALIFERSVTLMQKVVCPYCGRVAKYVDSSVIYYGHSYGMAYLCRPCNAYVGVHSGTDRPKGSLANAELRGWRKATHARFDPLWRDGPFKKRNAAYRWLSEQMKLPIEQTHIGSWTKPTPADAPGKPAHRPQARAMPNPAGRWLASTVRKSSTCRAARAF